MIEFIHGLSAIEVQYLANMGAILVLFLLVIVSVCGPTVRWVLARFSGNPPPMSLPSILLLAGFQFILWGLYFRYVPGQDITLADLEQADPTIAFDDLFLGLSKLEVIKYSEIIALAFISLVTIGAVVNPFIQLAFNTLPTGAQKLSDYLFKRMGKTPPQAVQSSAAQIRRTTLGFAILWVLFPAAFYSYLRFVEGRSFGPPDPILSRTEETEASGESYFWGLSKLETIWLMEQASILLLSILVIFLVVVPLMKKAMENLVQGLRQMPTGAPLVPNPPTTRDIRLSIYSSVVIWLITFFLMFVYPAFPILAKIQIP